MITVPSNESFDSPKSVLLIERDIANTSICQLFVNKRLPFPRSGITINMNFIEYDSDLSRFWVTVIIEFNNFNMVKFF